MTLILRHPATPDQLAQMSEAFSGTLIKLAVDNAILPWRFKTLNCNHGLKPLCGDCWR